MRRLQRALVVCTLALLLSPPAAARPEKIRPDHSYYSDEFSLQGLVSDLVGEKNYEEVYQLYSYYEAVYDAAGRVVLFREYERGSLVRSERYRYGPGGELLERKLKRPGKPVEISRPAAG